MNIRNTKQGKNDQTSAIGNCFQKRKNNAKFYRQKRKSFPELIIMYYKRLQTLKMQINPAS